MNCIACSQPAAWSRTSGGGANHFCDTHARAEHNWGNIPLGGQVGVVWYPVSADGRLGPALLRTSDFPPPPRPPVTVATVRAQLDKTRAQIERWQAQAQRLEAQLARLEQREHEQQAKTAS